jgi:hypothetical protein
MRFPYVPKTSEPGNPLVRTSLMAKLYPTILVADVNHNKDSEEEFRLEGEPVKNVIDNY